MSNIFTLNEYTVTTVLMDTSIHFKVVNTVSQQTYEHPIQLSDINIQCNKNGIYTFICNCFSKIENYSVIFLQKINSLEMKFNVLFDGFFNSNFNIVLPEKKIESNDLIIELKRENEKLKKEINDVENKINELETANDNFQKELKNIHFDYINKLSEKDNLIWTLNNKINELKEYNKNNDVNKITNIFNIYTEKLTNQFKLIFDESKMFDIEHMKKHILKTTMSVDNLNTQVLINKKNAIKYMSEKNNILFSSQRYDLNTIQKFLNKYNIKIYYGMQIFNHVTQPRNGPYDDICKFYTNTNIILNVYISCGSHGIEISHFIGILDNNQRIQMRKKNYEGILEYDTEPISGYFISRNYDEFIRSNIIYKIPYHVYLDYLSCMSETEINDIVLKMKNKTENNNSNVNSSVDLSSFWNEDGNINDVIEIKETSKCMSKYLKDGDQVRHKTCGGDIWHATYNCHCNKLLRNNEKYSSPKDFLIAHIRYCRRPVHKSPDGMEECECYRDGKWIKLCDL